MVIWPGKFGQSGVRSCAGTHRGAPLSPPRRILTLSSISPTSFVLLRGHLIQTNVISPNVLSHGNSIVLVIIALAKSPASPTAADGGAMQMEGTP